MNRRTITTIAAIAFGLTSLSACKLTDVSRIERFIPTAPTEGFTPAVVAPCEGAACPTPPPVSYPCVNGEGAIVEGAGSYTCP